MNKVLIVDDEYYIRAGLEIMIPWDKYGFSICGFASNGEEAIESIKELKPDLVITDIRMPLIDGLEVVRIVTKELLIDVRFIILSGFSEFEYAQKAIEYKVDKYILKPVEQEELIEALIKINTELEEKHNNIKLESHSQKVLIEKYIRACIHNIYDNELEESIKGCWDIINEKDFRYIELYIEKLEDKETFNKELLDFKKYLVESIGENYEFNIIENYTNSHNEVVLGIVYCEIMKSNNSIKETFNNVYNYIKSKTLLNFNIFIGKKVEKHLDLHKSYESIKDMRNIIFQLGNRKIFIYEDMENLRFNNKYSESEFLNQLILAVEVNNIDNIKIFSDKIFLEIKENMESHHIAKVKLNYYIHSIINLINTLNGNIEEIKSYNEAISGLNKLKTIDELRERIFRFSIDSGAYMQKLRQGLSLNGLNEIEQYINNNYSNNITLKNIANEFYMNSAYLGRIFKKKYNVSFNEYLNNLRVDKAKELLRRTDKKIYEIAEIVGYKDSEYFISKFEKNTGKTPYQYRKEFTC